MYFLLSFIITLILVFDLNSATPSDEMLPVVRDVRGGASSGSTSTSAMTAAIDMEGIADLSSNKQHIFSESSHSLNMVWINLLSHINDEFIAPEEAMNAMLASLWQWRELNPDKTTQVWHYSPTFEQLDNTSVHLPPWVQLRSIDSIIDEIPEIIEMTLRDAEFAARVKQMLPKIFTNPKISVYFKADLARLLIAMHQCFKKPRQKFMYADASIEPHNMESLFASYQTELDKFGIVMANASFHTYADTATPIVKPSENASQYTIGVNVSYPGFENGAFIGKFHPMLFQIIAFIMHPFMDKNIIGKLVGSEESESSQAVFSMMRLGLLYGMCTVSNAEASLHPRNPPFTAVHPSKFFPMSTFEAMWPDEMVVNLGQNDCRGPEGAGMRLSLGQLMLDSMVFNTCLQYSCLHPKEETSRIARDQRNAIILQCIQSKPWGEPCLAAYRSLAILAQMMGAQQISQWRFPVMCNHELVTRTSHFAGLSEK